jgi:hypothetical protein
MATVCWLGELGPFELGPCGGADAGVAYGEGFGVSEPTRGELGFAAVRAGAIVSFPIDAHFALELGGAAVARIGGAAFVLDGIGAVHEPAAFGARLDAGVAVRFP